MKKKRLVLIVVLLWSAITICFGVVYSLVLREQPLQKLQRIATKPDSSQFVYLRRTDMDTTIGELGEGVTRLQIDPSGLIIDSGSADVVHLSGGGMYEYEKKIDSLAREPMEIGDDYNPRAGSFRINIDSLHRSSKRRKKKIPMTGTGCCEHAELWEDRVGPLMKRKKRDTIPHEKPIKFYNGYGYVTTQIYRADDPGYYIFIDTTGKRTRKAVDKPDTLIPNRTVDWQQLQSCFLWQCDPVTKIYCWTGGEVMNWDSCNVTIKGDTVKAIRFIGRGYDSLCRLSRDLQHRLDSLERLQSWSNLDDRLDLADSLISKAKLSDSLGKSGWIRPKLNKKGGKK